MILTSHEPPLHLVYAGVVHLCRGRGRNELHAILLLHAGRGRHRRGVKASSTVDDGGGKMWSRGSSGFIKGRRFNGSLLSRAVAGSYSDASRLRQSRAIAACRTVVSVYFACQQDQMSVFLDFGPAAQEAQHLDGGLVEERSQSRRTSFVITSAEQQRGSPASNTQDTRDAMLSHYPGPTASCSPH